MVYVVKWTENGKKRQLHCLTREFAVVMLNRLIINCAHYDAVLVGRKG
jgi:hypothetical protein